MFDVCTSRKNSFEIDPLSLDVDPNICKRLGQVKDSAKWKIVTEKYVNPVELVLPRARLERILAVNPELFPGNTHLLRKLEQTEHQQRSRV